VSSTSPFAGKVLTIRSVNPYDGIRSGDQSLEPGSARDEKKPLPVLGTRRGFFMRSPSHQGADD